MTPLLPWIILISYATQDWGEGHISLHGKELTFDTQADCLKVAEIFFYERQTQRQINMNAGFKGYPIPEYRCSQLEAPKP